MSRFLPLESVNPLVNLLIRDVAKVRRGLRPGELDRDMSQRYLTLVANVEGEDMGRASRQVAQAIANAGEPPRGVRVEPMGQLPPMIEMFKSLGIGLGVAVFVIFVLLTAYFQSPRLALISVGAVPGVLAGIATILYFTRTSLNIESFMGSIMSLGVSVSNSVLLVTFMDQHWKAGASSSDAAIVGAGDRSAADPHDRLCHDGWHGADGPGAREGQPDAGAAGPGGDRRSGDVDVCHPAGASVDLHGRDRPAAARSPSVYPDDRHSTYYDPMVFSDEVDEGDRGEEGAQEVVRRHTADELIGFLRSILHELRSKRHDMITHHNLDDLLGTLGFGKNGTTDAESPSMAMRTGTHETAARHRSSKPVEPPALTTHGDP